MERISNHVIPRGAGWAVTKAGAQRASKCFDSKEEAKKYGRALSRKERTELYIHKSNGMIEDWISYDDIRSPKGKQ